MLLLVKNMSMVIRDDIGDGNVCDVVPKMKETNPKIVHRHSIDVLTTSNFLFHLVRLAVRELCAGWLFEYIPRVNSLNCFH